MNSSKAQNRALFRAFPHLPRRMLSRIAKLLLGAALVLILCLVGALIWLRTPSATQFLAKTATGVLQEQGFTLSMKDISGPLPGRLAILNLALADTQGVLLQVQKLEMGINLPALLKGSVEVELVLADALELFRLPSFPPAPNSGPREAGSGGMPVLPFDIVLDKLALRQAKIHTAALLPQAGPGKHSVPSRILQIDASVGAALRGDNLSALVQAAVKDEKRQGVELEIQLASNTAGMFGSRESDSGVSDTGKDRLRVSLRAEEQSDGPVALLANMPDFPGYRLVLEGDGPVAAWQGSLTLELSPRPDAASAQTASHLQGVQTKPVPGQTTGQAEGLQSLPDTLFRYEALLRLKCATGSLWTDLALQPDFQLALESRLRPGKHSPAQLLPVLGESLFLNAQVEGRQSRFMASADARSPALELDLKDAFIGPSASDSRQQSKAAEAGSPLEFGASIQTTLLDLPSLLSLGSLFGSQEKATPVSAAPPGLPINLFSLTTNLAGIFSPGAGVLEAKGSVATGMRDKTFSMDYSLDTALEGKKLLLRALRLHGLGIDLNASGQARIQDQGSSQAIQGEALFTAADQADWQTLACALARFAPASGNGPPPLGGTIRLEASFALPATALETATTPASPDLFIPATGHLALDATDMRWPTPELSAIFGKAITVRAGLSGGGDTPYALTLEDVRTGIFSLAGSALFSPERNQPGTGSGQSTTAAGGSGEPPKGSLNATLAATISDLQPLLGRNSGLAGALETRLTANGPLDALNMDLALSSDAVKLPGGEIRSLSLKADTVLSLSKALLNSTGGLQINIGHSPGGPVSFSTRWNASLPQDQTNSMPTTATIQDLRLQGAGVDLKADLSAVMAAPATAKSASSGARQQAPPSADPASPPLPAINGSIQAAVQDWTKIAALAGVPLSGAPAKLELNLAHAANKQSLALSANLPHIRLRETGTGSSVFFLRDCKLQLAASNLSGMPDIDLNLQTGTGLAGPLFWNNGKAGVKAGGGKGAFSLVLLQEGGARPQQKNKSAERLALQGNFDLSRQEVTVQNLTLHHPQSATGLNLRQPLAVSLENGLTIKNFSLDFKPSGRLTANAAFAPDALALKCKLEALPFSFFKLFTSAPLPDGELSAQADFSSSKQGPRGGFSARTRISSTQAVAPSPADQAGAAQKKDRSFSMFELQLAGELATSPGQPAVSGSGVRGLPGVLWLRGNGTLGSAGSIPSAREGKISFQVPLRVGANGLPAPDSAAPLAALFYWKGAVDPLWQIVPMPDRYLTGQALLDLKVSGSLNRIKHELNAYVAGCRFQDVANGLLINGINLEARSASANAVRAVISANDGQSGRLAMEADLTGLAGSSPALSMRGQLDKFRPLHRDDLSISLSGILGLNGPLSALVVTSDILVDQGELLLSSKLGGSVTTLEVERKKSEGDPNEEEAKARNGEDTPPPSTEPVLDMRIRMPQHFFIRGMGLDCEWEGDLRIVGSTSAPSLTGSLHPVRGYLDIFSRTFLFSEGDISFYGGSTIDPALNLDLTYTGPNIAAVIRAGGTAKKPKLALESRPPLPQDEVLAQVLFGKRTSELSRFEAIQLANSLRELTGVGGSSLDVMTTVRKSVGLDMLRLGGGNNSSKRTTAGQSGESDLTGNSADGADAGSELPSLEAGKYINESVYVGVEQGATADSTAVRVEVELFPSVTLQGKSSTESSEVGIGWKMDY